MNRVMGLDGGHKSTPNYAALFSVIAVLLVAIVEKAGDFECSVSVNVVLGGRVVEHAIVEEYVGPKEACESCNYFEIGCPSAFRGLVGYV
jgi:hypothetical protein